MKKKLAAQKIKQAGKELITKEMMRSIFFAFNYV